MTTIPNYCNSFLAGFTSWHHYCWQLVQRAALRLLAALSNHAALDLLFIHFSGGLWWCINFQMSQLVFKLLPIMGVPTSNGLFVDSLRFIFCIYWKIGKKIKAGNIQIFVTL